MKKTFGDVGDDDADEEDDSVEPLVAQRERNDEEGDAEEYGNSGDDVDEMFNFLSDGSLSATQSGSQSSDATHHSVVTDADDHTLAGTCKLCKLFQLSFNSSQFLIQKFKILIEILTN